MVFLTFKKMKINQGVHQFFIDKKQIALIDNTDNNRIVVLLTDKKEPYKQVFFIDKKFKQLVNDTQEMRRLGLKSF